MPSIARLLALAALAGAATLAQAADTAALRFVHPWARATAHGQHAGGAYLEIENRGAADRLVGVRGDVADAVQLHSMKMEGNVMRMREAGPLEVPANGKLTLAPGGLHIMLMGLKKPLAAGSSFPLTLQFEKAGEVKVEVQVESAIPPGHEMKH